MQVTLQKAKKNLTSFMWSVTVHYNVCFLSYSAGAASVKAEVNGGDGKEQ